MISTPASSRAAASAAEARPPDAAAQRTPAADPGPGVEPAGAEWHRGWLKIAIALVLAGQGMAFGLAANMSPPSGAAFWVLHGGLAASAVAVLALLGGPLLRETFASLRAGRVTVDLLFVVTLAGAFGVSVFSTLRREGPVFYELVAILLAIYTVGKLLGARSRARALQALERFRAEHETCVVLGPDGARRTAQASEVRPGERVVVAPGAVASVDGVIAAGRALVLTTPLTGEPHPAALGPGDELLAGMRSVDGTLVVDVRAAGGARRIDRMLSLIEATRLRPSRLQAMADRLAARFVPVVVAVSAATFAFWLWRGGLVPGIENGLAVLVVACPCALGLATPLGIWAGLVGLGRLGIVARSGDFLDALAGASHAIFDKTGTLFEPELGVARFTLLDASPHAAEAARAMIATAEAGMEHPVARALHAGLGNGPRADAFELVEARVLPGRGLRARLRDRSTGAEHELVAGAAAERSGGASREPGADEGLRDSGLRRIAVAIDGAPAAEIELDERPRERARGVFEELRALGFEVEILTGDPAFADDVWPDIPRRTGVAPEEKAVRVHAVRAAGGRVLFVGDGLNDAAALAAADASVAIRQGADLARSHALAVIAGDSLGTLPAAVRLARAVRGAIRSNLVFAACYNAAGMAIAAAGWLDPVVAALLMAGSSALVSTRVLRAA